MDLIAATYMNSDSEDESDPSAGTAVSTKRPHSCDDARPLKKLPNNISERLPTPSFFLKTESPIPKHIDDPSTHGYKIRSFPHERGNWATFVYLPLQMSEDFVHLVHSLLEFPLQSSLLLTATENLHVSLTRTVVLRHHWIDDFVSSVRKSVSQVPRFRLHFQNLAVYVNEEKTRTFVGVQIMDDPCNTLNYIVSLLNNCLTEYKLPSFYKDPSFHASIAWCLGDKKEELEKCLSQFSYPLLENISFPISELICKASHMRFACPLK